MNIGRISSIHAGREALSPAVLLPVLVAVAFLAFTPLKAEVIEETGSLRGFLAGDCPSAAYDNWISHTVEGIASAGYNDHGPAGLDRQLDGFGEYRLIPDNPVGDAILERWRQVLREFMRGRLDVVDMMLADSADSWHYEVVLFHDTEYRRDYYVLREQLDEDFVDNAGTRNDPDDDVIGSFRNGWGIWVIDPESPRPYLMIQMVHPNDDFLGIQSAIDLFFRLNSGALNIHGCGREVVWTQEGDYTNSKSLSDPSRNGRAPLQVFHELFADSMDVTYPPGPVIVQCHSYDRSHTSPKSVILSAGQYETFIHKPLRDRGNERHDIIDLTPQVPVPANTLGWHPETTIQDYYWLNYDTGEPYYYHTDDGDSLLIPRATYLRCDPNNQQENYLHDNDYIDGSSYENFIHYELDEFPDILDDAGFEWTDLLGDERPPTFQTFEPVLSYYEPFHQAFADWFDILDSGLDTIPPPRVTGLEYAQPNQYEFRLSWNPVLDGSFVTYEVVADTGEVTANSPVCWDLQNDPELRAMDFDGRTTVTTLPDGYTWNVAMRAVDYDGNRGQLSNDVEITLTDNSGIGMNPRVYDAFPYEAWHAWAITEIDDPNDLDSLYIEWATSDGDSGYSLLEPLFDNDVWGIAFNIDEDDLAVDDTVFYRFHITDLSVDGNQRTSPTGGNWYRFVLTDDAAYPVDFDFEDDDGGLNNTGDWEWGEPSSGPDSAYSGNNLWATDLSGDYSNLRGSDLRVQNIGLQGYGPMVFTWTQWYEFQEHNTDAGRAYDGGLVRLEWDDDAYDIVPVGGYTHRIVSASNPEDGSDVYSGSSGQWQTKVVNLIKWVGQEITLIGLTAASNSSTSREGWYVDDVAVVRVVNTQPPGSFTLISPEDDMDANPHAGTEFCWNASFDPDPFAVPEYDLILALNEDTITVYAGEGETVTVQLDTLGLHTEYPAYIYWWVIANSQGDIVRSYNSRRIAVPPFSEVIEETGLPSKFSLEAAYPNPFNPALHLRITLPEQAMVKLEVFNILGQRVDIIDRRLRPAGSHEVIWNADHFASGLYLIRMEAGNFNTARKVVLVK